MKFSQDELLMMYDALGLSVSSALIEQSRMFRTGVDVTKQIDYIKSLIDLRDKICERIIT